MSGWVLTSERKPTADDADENTVVWVQMSNGDVGTRHMLYVNDKHCEYWHPKPKAEKPEPYKPPVHERVERWCHVNDSGDVIAIHKTQCYANANPYGNCRVAHLREVRDGDPSPEDVAAVLEDIDAFLSGSCTSGCVAVARDRLRKWKGLLGGKP